MIKPITLLSAQNICKNHKTKRGNEKQIFNAISFDVHEGEITSFLGVNGSGKTTLASILASLCPPLSGDIFYNGVSIYKDLAAYRYKMGFCQSLPNFNNALSVKQNLIFTGRFFGLAEEESSDRAHLLASELDFEKHWYEHPNELSGGYIKRVMIARALMHNPKLLIIDDLSAGLDLHIKQYLWEFIQSLKEKGMTIIITTNNVDEAEFFSDRICILHQASVLTIDTPENLKLLYDNRPLAHIFTQLTSEDSEE